MYSHASLPNVGRLTVWLTWKPTAEISMLVPKAMRWATLDGCSEKLRPLTIMKANGGRRYKAGAWTTDPPNGFNAAGAIAISDDPALGGDSLDHEADGHTHQGRCLSCVD